MVGDIYKEVMGSLEGNKRNSLKHRIEEHDMLNCLPGDVCQGSARGTSQ